MPSRPFALAPSGAAQPSAQAAAVPPAAAQPTATSAQHARPAPVRLMQRGAPVRPAMPQPDGALARSGARPQRLQPAPWPAITQPGHADRRAAVERDALPDVLLAVHQRAWPLSLGWPTRDGWCQCHTTLTQVQPVIGGWWLQWHQGALLLPDELMGQAWRLSRQRRDGLDQHLMVTDALGRPTLLLGMAAQAGALHCGWQCLLDELAPWPPA
ncbi:hypothetical protein [Aquabacterium sp. OR-4]|uniref:hypothetical protein n=1 Tax=Aquabacterium sp. OR-4 TaxID=2978127 RepID=UPI0021B2A0D6|nr:hypothetical protein [Aquabacterium sp. OR-4]MDT7838108.1 hypothetical protein [Aquabacterium sp. OR-4]